MRAKAVAEKAVMESSMTHTVFAPSIVYAPRDPYLRLLQRLSYLPLMPLPGSGRAPFQPIWAEDVAQCVMAALPGGPLAAEAENARFELAGPETLTHADIVAIATQAFGRNRVQLHIPTRLVRRTLKAVELLMGPTAFATWDEAELLEIPMTTPHGTVDAERLGVSPQPMRAVLGVGG
jgi:NADH dehydrogenase